MQNPRIITVLAVLAIVGGAAGCATSTTPKPASAVADSEYEMVTQTGSNIPVRVRKGTTAETPSPVSTISGDAAQQMLTPRGAGQSSGGGK